MVSIEKFRCDRLVKWRIRSLSATSGNGGGLSASWSLGIKPLAGFAGTSNAGSRWHRRPGLDRSNNRAVDWVLCISLA